MGEIFLGIFLTTLLAGCALMLVECFANLALEKSVVRWIIEAWEGVRGVREDQLLTKGIIKSDAFREGYCDMAMSICKYLCIPSHTCSSYYFDNDPGVEYRLPEEVLRSLASNPISLRKFKPSQGRKKNKYMVSNNNQVFRDYYAGGMALLADIDDFQSIIIEEDSIVVRRLAGLEDADRHYLESKKQLDMLRNKTFNREIEHKEFDALMGGPKRKFWQRKEVV